MKKEQEGIVIELNDSIAKVKMTRHGDCENCGSCPGSNALIMEVYNAPGAKKGDHVIVELKDKNMLKAAFIVYVLPLIFVFIGVEIAILFSKVMNGNLYAFEIMGGIIAFVLSILLIYWYEKTSRNNINKLPKIVKVV